MAVNGRTEFKCLDCDLLDPLQTDAVKWAKSPLAAPVIDFPKAEAIADCGASIPKTECANYFRNAGCAAC